MFGQSATVLNAGERNVGTTFSEGPNKKPMLNTNSSHGELQKDLGAAIGSVRNCKSRDATRPCVNLLPIGADSSPNIIKPSNPSAKVMNKTSENFLVGGGKSSYLMNSLKEEEQESSARGDKENQEPEKLANFSDSSPMKINKSYTEAEKKKAC